MKNTVQFEISMSTYDSCNQYDKYCKLTNNTQDKRQSTIDFIVPDNSLTYTDNINFHKKISSLYMYLRNFTEYERWRTRHNARDLMVGLITETGQLAEYYLWPSDNDTKFIKEEVDEIA